MKDPILINGKPSTDYYVKKRIPTPEDDDLLTIENNLLELDEQIRKHICEHLNKPSVKSLAKKLNDILETRENKKHQLKILESSRILRIKQKILDEQSRVGTKYYASLCLIIKDENEYLEEWLNWHLGQGIEHFYIYDHAGTYSVKAFISTLDKFTQNKITVVGFGGNHEFAQHEAYNDCLKKFGRESRWIGFIDSDEMVRTLNGQTLNELLVDYEEYAGLFVIWKMYGANGKVEKENLPCRRRFTTLAHKNLAEGVGKVFVQPVLMQHMITHNGYPHEGFVIVDELKRTVGDGESWIENATTDIICIDHYYTKSYQEWLEKLSRGTCDPYCNRKYEDFFNYNPDMEYCREKVFPTQEYEISNKKIQIDGVSTSSEE